METRKRKYDKAGKLAEMSAEIIGIPEICEYTLRPVDINNF
jgi:hypothetical protein